MSAIDAAAAGPRAGLPGRGSGTGTRRLHAEAARILLRLTVLELRRSPMPLMLPLVAVLFWFDALRTGQGLPAIWTQRASILPDHVMPDLGPISAGMAAWVGGREQRRGMGDLAESTARPRWLRQLAAWGGATGWTLVAYAACTTVIYVLAARVVPTGGPPIWPVVVVGVTVTVFCTAGFVVGALFPGRFTAPLAAIGTMFVALLVFQSALNAASGLLLLSPDNIVPPLDWGVFHPVPPDLPIVQTVFLGGLVVVLLGVLGVFGSVRGAQLRRSAVAVTAVGLAACVAGLGLASTATRGGYGYEVSALHDAASDRPIPYTPVCTQGSAIPVCVHPVFAADLPAASAAFAPLLAEVAGLPGAPARVTQVDSADLPQSATADGHSGFDQFDAWSALATAPDGTAVLEFGYGDSDAFKEPFTVASLRGQAAQQVAGHIIAPNGHPDAAQQAVELALVQRAGGSEDQGQGQGQGQGQSQGQGQGPGHGHGQAQSQGPATSAPTPAPTAAVAAAAARFAELTPSQSHAWLVAHLSQLRAGQITPGELP